MATDRGVRAILPRRMPLPSPCPSQSTISELFRFEAHNIPLDKFDETCNRNIKMTHIGYQDRRVDIAYFCPASAWRVADCRIKNELPIATHMKVDPVSQRRGRETCEKPVNYFCN